MNRIALITGATSGIGEACARKFAGSGYDLVLTGRNKEKLEAMKAELEGVEVTTTLTCWSTTPGLLSALTKNLRATSMNGQQ